MEKKFENITDMTELYNVLEEKWWELKHENIMHMDGVKGYEFVDVAANYYRMEALEEVIRMIES